MAQIKITTNGRQPQIIESEISQQPLSSKFLGDQTNIVNFLK
jgi:hypothetical protein